MTLQPDHIAAPGSPETHAGIRWRGLPRYLFIIGAQRSGTTFLANALDQHPDVTVARPLRPEPKYLLKPDIGTGPEGLESRHFSGVPDHVLRVEKSTSYIEHTELAQRIAHEFPTARCMARLRDPVERAVSNYWFSVQHGLEARPPEDALDPRVPEKEAPAGLSASPFAYLRRGRYLDFLDGWERVLGGRRLLVLQTEHLVNDAAAWAPIHAFLGVEPINPTGTRETVNAAPRSRQIDRSTLEALARHFESHNAALAARFPVDLSLWRSPS